MREVEEGLEKKEYAPQFREVLERVRKTMETKNGGSAMVETAAAEYAMLHLGGRNIARRSSRYPGRKKRKRKRQGKKKKKKKKKKEKKQKEEHCSANESSS